MTTISAKTVLRSRNASAPDKVLSTLLLRYPRFIHSEMLTHRALSRNAASNRAIPVKKMIDDILADTAMPIHWGAAQKGMQADQECDALVGWFDPRVRIDVRGERETAWLHARDEAIRIARGFDQAGYHKQVTNRLLEPYMHITVLVSASEWQNFLDLRDHPAAEPHIQMLAREIRNCLDNDPVQDLQPGQWHMPFVDDDLDYREVDGTVGSVSDHIKLSVARCASTSYKTVDGFDMTPEKAIELHDKLVGSRPIHASPCEHVAQADEHQEDFYENGEYDWVNFREHGNFVGFRQYRRMLERAA